MFSTEYPFDEIPLAIGQIEIANFSGTALLEGENGPHDYGFSVVCIELNGNLVGSYRDKRTVNLEPGKTMFEMLIFNQIKDYIEADKAAKDHFYDVMREANLEMA